MARPIACLSIPVKMISTFHAGSKCFLLFFPPFFDIHIHGNETFEELAKCLFGFFLLSMNYYVHFEFKDLILKLSSNWKRKRFECIKFYDSQELKRKM